jgi:hypothetical protein
MLSEQSQPGLTDISDFVFIKYAIVRRFSQVERRGVLLVLGTSNNGLRIDAPTLAL